MKKIISVGAIVIALGVSFPSFAEKTVNTGSMKKAGFGAAAKMYDEMSPEQKSDVNAQATKVQADMKKMSKAEKRKLQKRLKRMAKSLGVEDYDVSSVDTKRKVTVNSVDRDIKSFKKRKRSRGAK